MAAEQSATPVYQPDEVLKQLEDIPEDKHTFSSLSLLSALRAQKETLLAFKAAQAKGAETSLEDLGRPIHHFLKGVYHMASALPGAWLVFDCLEDLMARSGVLVPFLTGVTQAGPTVQLQLGIPTEEALCDTHEMLTRIAATAIVCCYHYSNYPAHPGAFPSEDAALLLSTLALHSCTDKDTAAAMDAQLAEAGAGVTVAEIRWLMHTVRAQSDEAKAIIKSFRFSRRYLDDLLSLNNPHLDTLFYNNVTYQGLRGLYPPELKVERQLHPQFHHDEMPFLDMLLVPTTDGGISRITTQLYEKRRQPAFSGVRLTRFIALDSSVNEQSKRSLLAGQFHRVRRRVMDPNNFCREMAHDIWDLVASGYSQRRLCKQLHRLIQQHPFMYFHARHSTHRDMYGIILRLLRRIR